MKIIRYRAADETIAYAALGADGSARAIEGDPFGEHRLTDEVVEVGELLAPIDPTQIIGIGLNYKRHAVESGMTPPDYPVVFHKTLNTVQAPGAPIVLPKGVHCEKTDYECELAVVIGIDCKDVPRERALEVVYGYTCANDVSARDWQLDKGGGQWSRGKSFDTFCPLGPVLVTSDEIPDPNALQIRTELNGDIVQDWNTDDMIFDVPALIEFLSAGTTLLAGTVILTGTPHGVGMASVPPRWLHAGDVVTVSVVGIGDLRNPVVQES
ncbi:MAG: fumarylacetoacetate hydrolase family protein [Trueperaceae bacterium]|nr:fumarylacetoacetate hydrolase family protein [Trueperaceae bacterium]